MLDNLQFPIALPCSDAYCIVRRTKDAKVAIELRLYLQVLQHVSTRCNQRLHDNDVCECFYYPNNTQVQTATFQTNGLRSVRLYVQNI